MWSVWSNIGVPFSKEGTSKQVWILTSLHLSLYFALVNSSPREELKSLGADEDDLSVATRDEERTAADLALAEPDDDEEMNAADAKDDADEHSVVLHPPPDEVPELVGALSGI